MRLLVQLVRVVCAVILIQVHHSLAVVAQLMVAGLHQTSTGSLQLACRGSGCSNYPGTPATQKFKNLGSD